MTATNRNRSTVSEGLDRQEMYKTDMGVTLPPVFKTSEEMSGPNRLEVHNRHYLHDHAHVNLRQEEYTPEEVALMLGTSLEVIMHAIWNGELEAERKGRNVVCIPRTALVAWYANLGSGI